MQDSIPVYVNPLVGENSFMRFLVGTPHEYIVVDSLKTFHDHYSTTQGEPSDAS